MKLTLAKLKRRLFYTIFLAMTLLLSSCHSPESDAKEVCDCYSKDQMDSKKECDALYKEYSEKYKTESSDNMKFQMGTLGCITAAAAEQMKQGLNEATMELNQSLGNSSESLSNLNQQINQTNQIFDNVNKKMEDVKFSFYIYSVLLILIGIGLAIYGLKYFKTALSLAFVIPTLVLLQMLDWLSMGWIISIITIGLLIFVFSKPLTYFTGWFFITVVVLIPFFIISENDDFRTLMTKIMMVISVVITYFLHKHIKATVIGISSGYCVGLGLASIICAKLFANGEFFNAFLVPGLIMMTGILLGLAYQYKPLFLDKNVNSSVFDYIEKNERENLNKTNFKDFLTKKNAIIAGILLVLISLLFGYQSFSVNSEETESDLNVTTNDSVVVNSDNQYSITDTVVGSQEAATSTITEDNTDSNLTINYDDLKGEWKGKFGKDLITINIESINADGSVTGYDEVKYNKRNLSGMMKGNEFILNEPGNDKWDGVFKFTITDDILSGSWASNNGKLRKEFTLSKVLY